MLFGTSDSSLEHNEIETNKGLELMGVVAQLQRAPGFQNVTLFTLVICLIMKLFSPSLSRSNAEFIYQE